MTLREYCGENEKKRNLCFLKRRSWPMLFNGMPVYKYKCINAVKYTYVKEKVKNYFLFPKDVAARVIDEAQVAAHQQLRYLRWYMRQRIFK